jgi:hypothetical protein
MRKLIITTLIISFILLIHIATGEDIAYPLKLIKALPVDFPERVDLSGLTIFHGTLFTVCDRHDDTIFRMEITDDKAMLVPHLKFRLPEPAMPRRPDFEGITCDKNGVFYLASESLFRILRVDPREEYSQWVTPDLQPYGEEVGLFQTRNANIEGITLVGEGQFVLCAERQPRGILEVDTSRTPCEIKAFKYDLTGLKLPEGRSPDFTGLFFDDQELYALQRNAYAISKLIRSGQTFEEKDFWSYESIVTSEELRYADMTYGRGEGLCMDAERIFVVLDNNGQPRYLDPEDCRPLLLIMERPRNGCKYKWD